MDSGARPLAVPGIAPAGLRAGFYSDACFLNASRTLERRARSGEIFRCKPILFFPARFDLPQSQSLDGYAHRVGVGSHLLRAEPNDYTADVARVRIGTRFRVVAKTGRAPRGNPDLRPVRLHDARSGGSR